MGAAEPLGSPAPTRSDQRITQLEAEGDAVGAIFQSQKP